MPIIKVKTLKTNFGELIVGVYEGSVCLCDWKYRSMRTQIDTRIQEGLDAPYQEESDPLLDNLENQLSVYFRGERKSFDLPLLTIGTDFQKEIWTELQKIKYGSTETYGGLAQRVGRPMAVRAAGSANGANAISIIIPCHRIIGSAGTLGGYAGGLTAKRKLLELESQPFLDWQS